jgi:hypothetical protein
MLLLSLVASYVLSFSSLLARTQGDLADLIITMNLGKVMQHERRTRVSKRFHGAESFSFFLLLVVLGFELKVSCLLGRHFTA